ncbi:MAG: hypothetical protein ABI446_04465 [Gemmatimonadaceae bacterium]
MTLGLAVASDAVRAVAMRDGVVKWAAQTMRASDGDLGAALTELLAAAPLPRWPSARVVAVIGPSGAQTKRLTGLPPVRDAAALAGVVRESAGRFFLRNGIPLTTSGLSSGDDGVWGAAFESPIIGAIQESCRARGLRVRCFAPTLVALPLATQEKRLFWRDGEVATESTYRPNGRLSSVRRRSTASGAPIDPPVVPALALLGESAWSFADAFGAAMLSDGELLSWRSGSERTNARLLAPAVKFACLAALIAITAALVVPSIGDAVAAHRAERQLSSLTPRASVAMKARGELDHMTRALAEISLFARRRHSPLLLLAALTRALPAEGALASIHSDSVGGTMVVVAPRMASALAALDSVHAVSKLEIVGPVTKEVANGREMERASVRFRMKTIAVGVP